MKKTKDCLDTWCNIEVFSGIMTQYRWRRRMRGSRGGRRRVRRMLVGRSGGEEWGSYDPTHRAREEPEAWQKLMG